MTPAQTARLAQVHADSAAAGTRVTSRELPDGTVHVTEHDGDHRASLTLGVDGQYLPC
jgi:hypothetical protein